MIGGWSKLFSTEYKRLASAAKASKVSVGAVQCLGNEEFCSPFTDTQVNMKNSGDR